MSRVVAADTYSDDEFRAVIERESARVERKTGAGGKPLQEAFVALSNTSGGVVVIGRALDQATEERIHSAAVEAHNLGRYEVRQVMVGGRPVVVIEVARREEGVA